MSLSSLNLDDRTFQDLLEEAKQRIVQTCPEWTDFEPGNPGMILLELFAHLTEVMIYRLNRVPDKAFIEFLKLMGITVQPPSAASVELLFKIERTHSEPVVIPKGTQVGTARATGGGEAPIFVTEHSVRIEPGEKEVQVIAHHGELIEGEKVGNGNGLPGQSYTVSRAPIVAAAKNATELLVGIEESTETLGERGESITLAGKTFRIWHQVDNFTNVGADNYVYKVDRTTGTIIFAPAVRTRDYEGNLSNTPKALAAIPPLDCEIRVWYRNGGGIEGNVAAHMLTVLKSPIPGVQVTNPNAATGGRAAEPLENALIRGPQELHSLQRAVTSRDFELLAQKSGAVARAKAFTKSHLWRHATPGTVEVLLVPYVPKEERGGGKITTHILKQKETPEACAQIRQLLEERRPLGTTCLVNWVRYKTIRVKARVVIYAGENPSAVRKRVFERLHRTLNPLPTDVQPTGWPFGQPLRASNVYDIILSEPGVNYVEEVELFDEDVPNSEAGSVVADRFQPKTWYASTGQHVFRSQDDGNGWEKIKGFSDETIKKIKVHPTKAGLVAAATHLTNDKQASRIYVSRDCGETWKSEARTAFRIEDMAWLTRNNVPVLLMATDVGLFELVLQPDATPVQVLVDPEDQQLGLFSIAVSIPIRGAVTVAVAARGSKGIYLSREGGTTQSFSHIGLNGEDIRVLEVQQDGVRNFLWAGVSAAGNEVGNGCFSVELAGPLEDMESAWKHYKENWAGGSCRSLAFMGSQVLAGTHKSGLLMLDTSKSKREWVKSVVGCGLPTRDIDRLFQPVNAVDSDPEGRLFLIGGPDGVYRSKDGLEYEDVASTVSRNIITVPETWLFCSGKHQIDVLSENEASRD